MSSNSAGSLHHHHDGPDSSSLLVSVGFSDACLLLVSFVGFVLLARLIHVLIWNELQPEKGRQRRNNQQHGNGAVAEDGDEDDEYGDLSTLNRTQRRIRARNIMKQQRRAAPLPAGAADANHNDEGNNDDQDGMGDMVHEDDFAAQGPAVVVAPVLSRRERQKLAKAAERQERRGTAANQAQMEIEQQRAKQIKQQQLEQQIQLQRQQQLAQERTRLEREQWEWDTLIVRRQEHLKQQLEGLEKGVEEEIPERLRVDEWVVELQQNRIVDLHELAKSWGYHSETSTTPVKDENWEEKEIELRDQPPLLTNSLVLMERIETLIEQGRLAGVLDKNNGIFIYISDQELHALAQTIKQQIGPITAQDVANICQELLFALPTDPTKN